jgi:hypothetical protein
VAKANVVKEEMQRGRAFKKCIKASMAKISQNREVTRVITSLTALVQYEPVARPKSSMSPR